MDDLEKAICGVECCLSRESGFTECARCPYRIPIGIDGTCENLIPLFRAILPVLKAQLPRLMSLGEVLAWAETPAEKRDPIFFEQKKGKGPSGWICNSLCPKDYYLCCLDGVARCWTSRPTDKQREAVKWDD